MLTLLVDGYNVVHVWPRLKATLDREGLEASRIALLRELAAYAAVRDVRVTAVFDGPRRPAAAPLAEGSDGVEVLFSGTGGHASADHVIERLAFLARRDGGAADVLVATGDRLLRSMVGAMGVASIDARLLDAEVRSAHAETARDAHALRSRAAGGRRLEDRVSPGVRARLEALRRGQRQRSPSGDVPGDPGPSPPA